MNLDLDDMRRRLFQAAAQPDLWCQTLAELNRQVGASGVALISTEERYRSLPHTPDMAAANEDYLRGWFAHDERYRGVRTMLEHGVTSEFDFTTPDEMRRLPFYADFLARHKLRWFAGVGVQAGSDLWCLSIQRSIDQGPFERHQLKQLQNLRQPFSDAVTLARLCAVNRLSSLCAGLDLVEHAAVICDGVGRICVVNETARRLLAPFLAGHGTSLIFRDPDSRRLYDELVKRALAPGAWDGGASATLHTTICGADRQPLLVRAIRIPDRAAEMFVDARLLLLFKKVTQTLEEVLASRFNLTRAEIEISKAIASGATVEEIAAGRRVSENTVRTQLKRIFAKTDISRQSQLALLVSGLAQPR